MTKRDRQEIKETGKTIAIYHAVFADEDFEKAASDIHGLVVACAKKYPGLKRHLFIDIDGHRNDTGGFDADMFEFQRHFVLGYLVENRFVSAVAQPLASVKIKGCQSDNMPDVLVVAKDAEHASALAEDIAAKTGIEVERITNGE